jgi:hypothetical protein
MDYNNIEEIKLMDKKVFNKIYVNIYNRRERPWSGETQ